MSTADSNDYRLLPLQHVCPRISVLQHERQKSTTARTLERLIVPGDQHTMFRRYHMATYTKSSESAELEVHGETMKVTTETNDSKSLETSQRG